MNELWYAGCHWLCARSYFEQITVLHPERLPADGPTLYVGLHRNGAVDGFVYRQIVPRGTYLISTQLRRSFYARLFFSGIAIARQKDAEDRGQNNAALRQCQELLAKGGDLIVLPEGTSSLGPRHLPFKLGAASIALAALAQGVPLRIVPLGLHYERAWAFRSKVEIAVGEPIATDFPTGLSELGRLKEMKRRMTTALEAIGANFDSAEAQENAERLAYAATLGTPRSYFGALKSLESGVPEPVLVRWRELEAQLAGRRVLLHQGVPLFPVGAWVLYAALLLVIGPLMLAGVLVNFPPLLVASLAARKLADDWNVIALWRILVGLPLFLMWFGVVSVAIVCFAGWGWGLGYALLTWGAMKSIYRVKKLAVAVWNGLAHRALAGPAHEFHQLVLQTIPPA
jgi:1-acyl-sn-glycerol-3-phosphate acyltransferase